MATIVGTSGNDSLPGATGDDSISGLGGNDTINGGFGNDTVLGGNGADSLSASDGTDLIDGGAGADYLSTNYFGNPTEGLWEDTLLGGGGDDYFWFAGSAGQDAPGRVLLDGGDGDDFAEIHMGYEDDRTVDLRSLNGGGTFVMPGLELTGIEGGLFDLGFSSSDLIYLPDLGVAVEANLGADTVIGGAGDDTIRAGAAAAISDDSDSLDGGGGNDTFELTYGLENSPAGVIDLSGFATGHLVLGDGNVIDNFEAGHITFGKTDDDIRLGASSGLTISGGRGHDTIIGGKFGNDIRGDVDNDSIDGRQGRDTLSGGDGADRLIGGRGDDLLDGGVMRDFFYSGQGDDTIRGGQGQDRFIYRSLVELDGDRITDLEANDKIVLARIDADTTTGGDQAFTVVSAFSGAAGELRVTFDGTDTLMELDTDGDGAADATLTATGDHAGYTDFVL